MITVNDIDWEIEVEEDDIFVRGNACASGDDEHDKQYEDAILKRLANGDVWAWASVCVIGRYGEIESRQYLGACSYDDENDFKSNSGYYTDMQQEALADIQAQLCNES